MDEFYNKLRSSGKNNVDNLVQWLKDAHILEDAKANEDKAKKMFDSVQDKSNVTFEQFNAVVEKLAKESNSTSNAVTQKLQQQGPKLMDALEAAGKAFKDAMNKK